MPLERFRLADLEHHPTVGASWEGYAVEEVLKALRPDETYYWPTDGGVEIDLLLFQNGRRIGVECIARTRPSSRLPCASRWRT